MSLSWDKLMNDELGRMSMMVKEGIEVSEYYAIFDETPLRPVKYTNLND